MEGDMHCSNQTTGSASNKCHWQSFLVNVIGVSGIVNSIFIFVFFTEKSVYLSPRGDIPFGIYTIPVTVSDRSGKQGVTQIRVNYCNCVVPSECERMPFASSSVTLGVWAILAMILGSLLLLCKYTFYFNVECKTLHFYNYLRMSNSNLIHIITEWLRLERTLTII